MSPAHRRVTVGGLSVGWLARQEQTPSPSCYRTVAYAYGEHVAAKWSRVPVGEVDSLDVKAWATVMARDGSSATVVNRAIGILDDILDGRRRVLGAGVQSSAPIQTRGEAEEGAEAENVQTVSKEPVDRRCKRRITPV